MNSWWSWFNSSLENTLSLFSICGYKRVDVYLASVSYQQQIPTRMKTHLRETTWSQPFVGITHWSVFHRCLHVAWRIMMTSSNGNIFPRYWPFVSGIHRSPVDSLHKGQWGEALMLSLICAWTIGRASNRDAGDLPIMTSLQCTWFELDRIHTDGQFYDWTTDHKLSVNSVIGGHSPMAFRTGINNSRVLRLPSQSWNTKYASNVICTLRYHIWSYAASSHK